MSKNAERLGPPLGADPEKPGPVKYSNSWNTVKRSTTISMILNLETNNKRPVNSSARLDDSLLLLDAPDVFNSMKMESDELSCLLDGNSSVLVN
jgi:hypothetical protein